MDYQFLTGGVHDVELSEGLASLTLLRKNVAGGDEAEPEVIHELVMPPAAFLNLFNRMDEVVKSLVEQGVVRVAEGEGK